MAMRVSTRFVSGDQLTTNDYLILLRKWMLFDVGAVFVRCLLFRSQLSRRGLCSCSLKRKGPRLLCRCWHNFSLYTWRFCPLDVKSSSTLCKSQHFYPSPNKG